MTVSELIKKLKKLPQNLEVAVAAHDNSDLEIQQYIHNALVIDFDEVRANSPIDKGDMRITGMYVVLR